MLEQSESLLRWRLFRNLDGTSYSQAQAHTNCQTWNENRIFSQAGWQQKQSFSSAMWGRIHLLKSFQLIPQCPGVTGDSVSLFFPLNAQCQLLLWNLAQFLALWRKIIWLEYSSSRSDNAPSDLKFWKTIKSIHAYNNRFLKCLKSA